MVTIKELTEALKTPERLVTDPKKKPEIKFKEFAESLLNNFQIRKGDDKKYWITEIEFYIYTDSHRDIITYPRNCEAGRWFFHASGVDITFKSEVKLDVHPKKKIMMPFLDNSAKFGGILIRGIEPAVGAGNEAKGPIKVCDELFDQFDAFHIPKDFPMIVEAPSSRGVSVNSFIREGFNPDAGKMVHNIVSYNYCGRDIAIKEDLIKEYDKYREKEYAFKAQS